MAFKEIYTGFNKFSCAPKGTKFIAVTDTAGNFKGYVQLNDEFGKKLGTPLYTFGLFSDLHNNEGTTGNTTDNDEDMANAMQFYKNNNVNFVACCGDVFSTANNQGMFQKFKQVKDANLGSIPLYACSGNHDCATSTGDAGNPDQSLWNTYLGTGTKFVITHADNSDVPENDVLIFFGESNNIFCNEGSSSANRQNPTVGRDPYTAEDVEWIRQQLETYKDKRVLVFNHLFFPGTCDAQNAYVNSSKYFSPSLSKIASLAYMYTNSIWFNGHNHWAYKEQAGDRTANVSHECKYQTPGLQMATQVHVSSCGGCREVNMSDATYRRNDLYGYSEGSIVEVYSDCIVYKCIQFSTTAMNYINKYMPTCQYIIPFENKQIPNWNIFEVTSESQLQSGNIGTSTTNGAVESNAKYVVSSDYIELDENKKYFIAVSRPVAGKSGDIYLGNFATGIVDSLNVSDSNTTPRLCRLLLHVYNESKAYLGYVYNARPGYAANYYFNDMTYFQDITDNIFVNVLGNIHNSGKPKYLKFRIEPGTDANTSVSACINIAKQFTIISCTKEEWEAMNS